MVFAALAAFPMASTSRALDQVLADLLAEMRDRLPPPLANLPEPNVSITEVSERSLAVGNWRGNEARGPLPGVALKGGHLDAAVRFQLWADEPTAVDTAMNELHGRLLAAKDELRAAGFLRLKADNTTSAEPIFVAGTNGWRKTSQYRVLYEFRYEDTDGAQSLIARIPVRINGAFGQSMMITDEMTRWDSQGTPALVVRGPFTLSGLSALVFVSGTAPSGTVSLTRTFDGAVGVPTSHPTLAAFLAAVAGPSPSERHARVTFASISDFLAAFSAAGDPVEMGDLDANGVPDKYNPLGLLFDPGIDLVTSADRFEIAFQNSAFDKLAVVYLRATP